MYRLENLNGSVSDFPLTITDYGATQPTCYEFKGPGYGQGTCVKNRGRSVWNRSSNYAVSVYYNSGCRGDSDTWSPYSHGNMSNILWEDNASHCRDTYVP